MNNKYYKYKLNTHRNQIKKKKKLNIRKLWNNKKKKLNLKKKVALSYKIKRNEKK